MAKFEVFDKLLKKLALFDKQKKWKPKASKLFWQNFAQ